MVHINALICRFIDLIFNICIRGNTMPHCSGLNTKKEQNLKLKTKKKVKLLTENFVATVKQLKALNLNIKSALLVNPGSTVVKIVGDKTGNKVTTKSVKKSKKELRNESF